MGAALVGERGAVGVPRGKESTGFTSRSLAIPVSLGSGAGLILEAAHLELTADGVEPRVELHIHTVRHTHRESRPRANGAARAKTSHNPSQFEGIACLSTEVSGAALPYPKRHVCGSSVTVRSWCADGTGVDAARVGS